MPTLEDDLNVLRNECTSLMELSNLLGTISGELRSVADLLDQGKRDRAETIILQVIRDFVAVGGIWSGPFADLATNLAKFTKSDNFRDAHAERVPRGTNIQ